METKRLITLTLLFACFAIVRPTCGQMKFWMSSSGDVAEGSTVGETPSIELPRGAVTQIYIWAQPEEGKTLENFSLNLTSESETAIEFVSAQVINGGRFEDVFDTDNGLDLSDQGICEFPAPLHGIWGLAGISIDPDGGTGLNAASPGADPHYSKSNESWLIGTIGYSAVANGTTDFYLEIGKVGMNYEGEDATEMTVQFGSAGDAALANGYADRCVRSATREARISVVDPLPGDFNLNGELDIEDIDLLSAEALAGTHNPYFNLTPSADVDDIDRVYWVETLKGTNFGDTDLDGVVDFADFLKLSGAFGLPAGWVGGDSNGDVVIDFADFLKLSGNFGKGTLFEASKSVPEPNGSVLMLVCSGGLLLLRRERRSHAQKQSSMDCCPPLPPCFCHGTTRCQSNI